MKLSLLVQRWRTAKESIGRLKCADELEVALSNVVIHDKEPERRPSREEIAKAIEREVNERPCWTNFCVAADAVLALFDTTQQQVQPLTDEMIEAEIRRRDNDDISRNGYCFAEGARWRDRITQQTQATRIMR